MLWVGTPYRRGLMYTSSRAGRYIVGASFRAPLTKALSVIGHGVYMGAKSGPGQRISQLRSQRMLWDQLFFWRL